MDEEKLTMEYICKRVSYGKKSTPVKDREYRLGSCGPVGTKKEIRTWAKKHNAKVKFVEVK